VPRGRRGDPSHMRRVYFSEPHKGEVRRILSSRSSQKSQKVKFAQLISLLKNPTTPLPSTLQGLGNSTIAVFWR
jgi:hypothetical protein